MNCSVQAYKALQAARFYFSNQGWIILSAEGEAQLSFDFVLYNGKKFKKVQVKSSRYINKAPHKGNYGYYAVAAGLNFNPKNWDYLFISTSESFYCIPSKALQHYKSGTRTIPLYPKYDKFKIGAIGVE